MRRIAKAQLPEHLHERPDVILIGATTGHLRQEGRISHDPFTRRAPLLRRDRNHLADKLFYLNPVQGRPDKRNALEVVAASHDRDVDEFVRFNRWPRRRQDIVVRLVAARPKHAAAQGVLMPAQNPFVSRRRLAIGDLDRPQFVRAIPIPHDLEVREAELRRRRRVLNIAVKAAARQTVAPVDVRNPSIAPIAKLLNLGRQVRRHIRWRLDLAIARNQNLLNRGHRVDDVRLTSPIAFVKARIADIATHHDRLVARVWFHLDIAIDDERARPTDFGELVERARIPVVNRGGKRVDLSELNRRVFETRNRI